MNEITMGADKLLDMVSQFVFDAKSEKGWEDLYEDIQAIQSRVKRISNSIEARIGNGR